MASEVLYEVKDRIAYITMNRPEKLNALDHEMNEGLYRAFSEVKDDPKVWVAIITGVGRSFSTGHDLVEPTVEEPRRSSRGAEGLYNYIRTIWKPVIAAVNGLCLAQGAGVALSSDIRIASDRAQFGWPQVKRGISSTSGPTILAQSINLGQALEILFTGEFIDAQEAWRIGLVNRVVLHEQLDEAAQELAEKIRDNAPLAVSAIKEIAVRGQYLEPEVRQRFSALRGGEVRRSEDTREGLQAFVEKRKPVFAGK